MSKKTKNKSPTKVRYNKISTELKKEIKKRYEYGENLTDLSIEYNVNFFSLKNFASIKGWNKGSRAEMIEAQEILLETKEQAKERKVVKDGLKNVVKSNLNYLLTLEKNKLRPENKSKEEALKHRISATKTLYDVAKDIFGIRTPKDELELRETELRYRKLAEQYDDGDIEV